GHRLRRGARAFGARQHGACDRTPRRSRPCSDVTARWRDRSVARYPRAGRHPCGLRGADRTRRLFRCRSATVRFTEINLFGAYVVTMAPEVAGRIVELPVADNQFVHKGDLLMVIDPTNFKIAVSLAEAAVRQAQANAQNVARQAQRRQRLSDLAETVEDRQT